MDIEDYIQKIIENGKTEDMEELSDMLEDAIEIIAKYDKNCYKEFVMELYKMAYGNKLTRKMAEELVNNMKPYGKKWNIEDIKEMQIKRGLDNINEIDFFVVMNSAYNDYKDIFGDDLEDYIRFTLDFIEDKDAKNDKVFLYFTTIPKN